MGAADADDAAVVSPVVRAQRKRRAHAQQKPPAVTPRGGAMTWDCLLYTSDAADE